MKYLWALVLSLILCAMPARADLDSEGLLKNGQADEALRRLNNEVSLHPENAAAYNQLCRVYFQLEMWDSALHMAEKSTSLEPRNSLFHQWVGRAAGRKAENSNPFTAFGLARKVKAEFERAVALDGNNISARSDLVEYYLEAPSFLGGDKNKARQQADAVALHDRGLADYLYARVEEKQGSGRAEQGYKGAIAASTSDAARYWVELAYFYRRSGRPQDMESAVNHSLQASGHDGTPLYDAAYLLLRTGRNYPGAVQMLRDYLDNHTTEDGPSFRAHYLLGELLEKQGDRERAIEEFRASLTLASEFRPARDALARVSR